MLNARCLTSTINAVVGQELWNYHLCTFLTCLRHNAVLKIFYFLFRMKDRPTVQLPYCKLVGDFWLLSFHFWRKGNDRNIQISHSEYCWIFGNFSDDAGKFLLQQLLRCTFTGGGYILRRIFESTNLCLMYWNQQNIVHPTLAKMWLISNEVISPP